MCQALLDQHSPIELWTMGMLSICVKCALMLSALNVASVTENWILIFINTSEFYIKFKCPRGKWMKLVKKYKLPVISAGNVMYNKYNQHCCILYMKIVKK